MKTDEKRVVLHDVRGMGEPVTLLDGIDQDGNVWVYRHLSAEAPCALCAAAITDGWVRFGTSHIVCARHTNISGKI